MADVFQHAVFLDYHPQDLPIAEELADRLRKANLRVWFEPSLLRPDADANEAIEQGLRESRSLVTLLSSSLLGAGWTVHERRTARFRDPGEPRRRFIPIVVDDCVAILPDYLRQYRTIDLKRRLKKQYAEIASACTSAKRFASKTSKTPNHGIAKLDFRLSSNDEIADLVETPDGDAILFCSGQEVDLYDLATHTYGKSYAGFKGKAKCLSLSPDGKSLAIGLDDSTIQILTLADRRLRRTPPSHQGSIATVEWAKDGRFLSGGGDSVLRVWQARTLKCVAELRGHSAGIGQVVVNRDGSRAITASYEGTIRIWDLVAGACVATLTGHAGPVNSVALLPDEKRLLSASDDCTLKLWDLAEGTSLVTMEGHRDTIWRVVVSPDGRICASGGWDNTVRVWDVGKGSCLQVLKFKDLINFLRFGGDGTRLYVGAGDTLYAHAINLRLVERISSLQTDTRRYTNAKVVLVGETTIGKSCLGNRLVFDCWKVEESTHGMRVWPLKLDGLSESGVEREVWLWDLAGQHDYRLIHQIFLDETALALVLFDPSNPDDPFRGLGHWEKALRQAVGHAPAGILVATKSDRSGVPVTRERIDRFAEERGYAAFIETSAKLGRGRRELLQAIGDHIPWDKTAWISTPRLFKVLKDEILKIRDRGLATIQFAALRQHLNLALPREPFDEPDLRTVARLLAGQGLIRPLKFGDIVLLRPELLNNYAAAVTRAVRDHAEGIGCIREEDVLSGTFDFQDLPRLSGAEEDILLRAVVQLFLERSLCLRQETSRGVQLVFPSHYKRELELPEHPVELVTYRFDGNIPDIYTTLVVRLRYTEGFEEPELGRTAAVFRTHEGYRLGLAAQTEEDGTGRLRLFFEPGVAEDTRVTLLRYVHEHLKRHALNIERVRHYVCTNPGCGRPYKDLEALRHRMAAGLGYIRCSYCDGEIPIVDLIEEKFREDRFERKVREMEEAASINLDNESKESILIGHAYQTAGEAGQIFRIVANSDHGIDGEIEFKDDRGEASGRRLYLQLKSGDSYTYRRAGDDEEIFTVKKERHLRYWQQQAYPVYLVIRTADGQVRWMNVTKYLAGRVDKKSLQIVLKGEPFTAYTLLEEVSRTLP